MDNPNSANIEKLELGEEPVLATKADAAAHPSIVRPSSLNYKISLLEAVQAF